MSVDDLAAELLATVLDEDPLSGSLYGFPGYDDLLPDFSEAAERDRAGRLRSLADRAEQTSDEGLGERETQTLDFVRFLAGEMADAATVPTVEFTVSDTFAAPVCNVLTMLPKLALDTAERRAGYLARLHALPDMLASAARRQTEGTAAGRTTVHRLVQAALAQLDLMIEDPTLGALARTDVDDGDFGEKVSASVAHEVRPALTTYRDVLRDSVLPSARNDDHPGICFLPGGDAMYLALARLHTSTTYSPDELHAMGLEIVEQVRGELSETGERLWGTTDIAEIFDRLSNDPSLRYQNREEMLEHARRAVAAAESEAPRWFATVPGEPCTVEAVSESEEAGAPPAYYMPGAIDGSRSGTYFLNTSNPAERHRYAAEDIAFHEAVPGHHFQLTIAMESEDLPPRAAGAPRHCMRRRMGPLQRAPGRRDGALQRRPGALGSVRRRFLACRPPGRRHRPARHGLVAPTGRPLAGRAHPAASH